MNNNNNNPTAARLFAQLDTLNGKLDKTNATKYAQYGQISLVIQALRAEYSNMNATDAEFFEQLHGKTNIAEGTAREYLTIAKALTKTEQTKVADIKRVAAEFVQAVNDGRYKLNRPNFGKFIKGEEVKQKIRLEDLFTFKVTASGEFKVDGVLADIVSTEGLEKQVRDFLAKAAK